jgi:hypothetical protein
MTVSRDLAENFKRIAEDILLFTLDPNQPAGNVLIDPEGGDIPSNTIINIPYSLVPGNKVVPLCGPNRTYYESRTVDGIEYGPDCWFEDPEFGPTPAGTVGVVEEGGCGTNLPADPLFVSTNTDFGTQAISSPIRFSNGVWR